MYRTGNRVDEAYSDSSGDAEGSVSSCGSGLPLDAHNHTFSSFSATWSGGEFSGFSNPWQTDLDFKVRT